MMTILTIPHTPFLHVRKLNLSEDEPDSKELVSGAISIRADVFMLLPHCPMLQAIRNISHILSTRETSYVRTV